MLSQVDRAGTYRGDRSGCRSNRRFCQSRPQNLCRLQATSRIWHHGCNAQMSLFGDPITEYNVVNVVDKHNVLSHWLDKLLPPPEEVSSSATVNAPLPREQELNRCSIKRKIGSIKPTGIDDSDRISVGSSCRIIANRPILEPTPPSTKITTRTPSPTRKLLTQLEQARPPLKCCQPGNAVGTLPERVVTLRRFLAKGLGKGCIPRDLEVRHSLICHGSGSLTKSLNSHDFGN